MTIKWCLVFEKVGLHIHVTIILCLNILRFVKHCKPVNILQIAEQRFCDKFFFYIVSFGNLNANLLNKVHSDLSKYLI